MPLSTLSQTLLYHHLSPSVRSLCLELLAAASMLLVFALGRLLHSNLCGLLAILVVVSSRLVLPTGAEGTIYIPLVLLAACFVVWRLRSPGAARSGVLGAAIGVSLLVRSPLFLFPFVLTALERLFHRGRPKSERPRRVWLVCIIPFALLLPWIYMNAQVHGRFVLFENGRAESNVMAGALGFVANMGGWESRVGDAFGIPDHLFSWAVVEVLTHPLRYFSAYCMRVWFVFVLHPVLMVLGLFSIWRFRKREDHLQVGALVLYLVGVHCLMAVEARYFKPVWPLLAVLAAAPFAQWLESQRRRVGDLLPMTLVWAHFVPAACMALFSLCLAAAYPHRRDGSRAALNDALARNPEQALLWSERGHRRMREGRIRDAAEDFAKAYSLVRDTLGPDKERELDYAWGLMLRGGPAANLIERVRLDEPSVNWRGYAIRLLGRLREGREREAREAYGSFRSENAIGCHSNYDNLTPNRTMREKLVEDTLCKELGETVKRILPLVEPLPSQERWKIVDKLLNFPGMDLAARIQAAEDAAEAGNRKAALAALSPVAAVSASDNENERMLRLFLRLGEKGRALELIGKLLRRPPESRKSRKWLDLAYLADEAGGSSLVLQALSRAEAAAPTPEDLASMARLYARAWDSESALELTRALLDRPASLSSRSWMDLAFTVHEAGDSALALRAFSRAESASPTVEELVSMARFYAQTRDFERALGATEALLDRPAKLPFNFWMGMAFSVQEAGDSALLRRVLARAEASSPTPDERAVMARFYARTRNFERALKLVRALLDRPASLTSKSWMELAVAAQKAGDSASARKALARAEAAGPTIEELVSIARFYAQMRDLERVARVTETLLGRSTRLPFNFWMELALSVQESGDSALLRRVLARAEASGPTPEERAVMARFYARTRNFEHTLELVRALLDRPANLTSKSWMELAIAAQKAGDSALARKALARAEASRPKVESVAQRRELARLYAELKEFKRAEALLEVSLKEHPDNAGLWLQMAFTLRRDMREDEALRFLERAYEAGPDAKQKRLIAIEFQDMERYGRAMSLFNELVAAHPRDPRNWSARGVLKALMGRRREAVEDLRTTVGLKPLLPEACLTLGGILTSMGETREAAALYERLLAENSSLAESSTGRLILRERERLGSGRP